MAEERELPDEPERRMAGTEEDPPELIEMYDQLRELNVGIMRIMVRMCREVPARAREAFGLPAGAVAEIARLREHDLEVIAGLGSPSVTPRFDGATVVKLLREAGQEEGVEALGFAAAAVESHARGSAE